VYADSNTQLVTGFSRLQDEQDNLVNPGNHVHPVLFLMKTEPVIGLDFGTTNSAIAVAGSDRKAALATFAGGSGAFRSILYFPAKERGSQQKIETQAGPDAINSYLEADTKGRLIVSIKSYLASSLFTSTSINGRNFTLEDLIAIILRRLRMAVMEQFETSASRVVLGRPVRFAGADTEADEKLALQRLQAAAELAGFKEVSFELEPGCRCLSV
jgi:hypothetical chaperone protein